MTNPAIGSTLVAAGHRTNYHDVGEGETLVLLHGSGPGVSAYWNWRDVIGPLSQHFRVIAPDIAGFGYSEFLPDATYSIKVWVSHLIGILDELGLSSATLVGNSFGGGLALAANMRHSDRIDALILMGTPAGEFERTEGLSEGSSYDTPSFDNMRRALEHLPFDPSVITDELVQARFEASARPGAQEAMRKLFPPAAASATVRGVPEAAIRKMAQPALILHGAEDRSIPIDVGYNLLKWLPNAEAHFFARTGHWVQAERPEAFVALIVDFMARTAASRGGAPSA